MYQSLEAGRRVTLDRVGHLRRRRRRARGRRAHVPDRRSETVDEIVRVSNDEICAAIKDVFDDTRSILEPAGALAVAGMRAWVERTGTTRRAARGGPERREHELRSAALRRRARGGRRGARGAVRRDDPGARRRVPRVLRRHRPARRDRVQLPAERPRSRRTSSSASRPQSRAGRGATSPRRSTRAGYETVDLTDNELAKLHVRHMVGGRSREVAQRAALPLRVPRAARRADDVPRQARRPLEHQPVPLPQPRRRFRPRARRLRGAARRDAPPSRRSSRTLGYRYQREHDNAAYDMFLA